MTPAIGYPKEAVIHLPVLHQAEAHLLHTALRDETEESLLIFGHPVYRENEGWRTWVLSAIPTVRTATRATVITEEESFRAASAHLRSPTGAGQCLVGWWHSQPGMGVHPSSTDVNSLTTFFNRPWMLMIIDDPLRRARAVYAWRSATAYHAIGYRLFTDDPGRYLAPMTPGIGTGRPREPLLPMRSSAWQRFTTRKGAFRHEP